MKSIKVSTNKITWLGGLYILQTLVYNFTYSGQPFLKDLWFVLNYIFLTWLLYYFRRLNSLTLMAFLVSMVKLLYNFGIMIKLWEYDTTASNYGVMVVVAFLFFITDDNHYSKWLRSLFSSSTRQ